MVSESRGITHYMCRAMERAAIAAIRTGREMLNLDSFQEEGIWDKPYV
jgi:hypothetical protein